MSLCLVDEDGAALEAALAFLNDCDDGAQDFSTLCGLQHTDLDALMSTDDLLLCSSNSDASSSESHDSAHTDNSDHTSQRVVPSHAMPTRQHVAAKRCNIGVPTVRRRASSDILELREQVLQLTAQLSKLQMRKNTTMCHGASSGQVYGPCLPRLQVQSSRVELGSAILERQKLREAEALNLKLRVAWRQQMKLSRKLENMLKKRMSTVDLDFLVGTQTTPLIPYYPKGQESVLLFAQLYDYLEALYSQTALIQASISERDTTRVFSSSHVHHDMLLGQTFEFTTNSPVQCEVRDLETHIWGLLSNEEAHEKPNVVHYDAREHSSTVYERQFTHKLDCQFGAIHVNGVSVIRKFVEPRRVVICYTSMLMLAGTELTFRESGWLILQKQGSEASREADNNGHRESHTLLQTCYRIHLKGSSSPSSSQSCPLGDPVYFQNFVVQSQCELMRTQQLHLQSLVLEKFSTTPPSSAAASVDAANTPPPKTPGCFFAKLPLF